MQRVNDPETVENFVQNHVWLDMKDIIQGLIEGLRDDLERTHIYSEGQAVGERTVRDDQLIKGQIRGLRDVLELPDTILDDLLATSHGAIEKEQEDNE